MDIEGMNSIQNKNWNKILDSRKKKEILVIQIKKLWIIQPEAEFGFLLSLFRIKKFWVDPE